MNKTYKFQIETNNKECFKSSIIEFAEMLKAENIDLETFAINHATQPPQSEI